MARPRKAGVRRDRNGKSRGEPEVIHPDVLAVRIREAFKDGIRPEDAKDQLAGFTLGRLLLRGRYGTPKDPGSISQEQYQAGIQWANIVRKHASIMGYKLDIHTPSFIMVGGGIDGRPEPEQRVILDIRRQWSDCYHSLLETAKVHGKRVMDVTYGVCVDNWPCGSLSTEDYGLLRCGLNTLAKNFR